LTFFCISAKVYQIIFLCFYYSHGHNRRRENHHLAESIAGEAVCPIGQLSAKTPSTTSVFRIKRKSGSYGPVDHNLLEGRSYHIRKRDLFRKRDRSAVTDSVFVSEGRGENEQSVEVWLVAIGV